MKRWQILGMWRCLKKSHLCQQRAVSLLPPLNTTSQIFHRHFDEILWFSGFSVRTTNDCNYAYYILYLFLNCMRIICACLVIISECHFSAVRWCVRRGVLFFNPSIIYSSHRTGFRICAHDVYMPGTHLSNFPSQYKIHWHCSLLLCKSDIKCLIQNIAHTVRSRYIMVIFLCITHERQSIARP